MAAGYRTTIYGVCGGSAVPKRRAFTLMEVLATIVMIGLIIPAAMKGISIATNLASDTRSKLDAINLAENRLAEILISEDWQSSTQSGNFEQEYSNYRWQMTTTDRTEPGLKQIELKVLWDRHGYEKNITLTTLVYNETQ